MPPLELILALGALWSLLHFWLVPLTKTGWSAVGLPKKMTRAGALVVLEKLRDLASTGAIAVAAVVVLVQLATWLGVIPIVWPKAMIKAAGGLYAFAKDLSEGYGTFLTVLGLIGATLALWWAARNAKQRVVAVWSAKADAAFKRICDDPEQLKSARQDPDLAPLVDRIDAALAALNNVGEPTPLNASQDDAAQTALSGAISTLAIAMASKEIDFPEVAAAAEPLAQETPPTPWRRVRAVLSSGKLSEDLGLARKPLGRGITALLFISLIGWASEPMADSLRLSINNMRVQAAHQQAQQNLDQMLSRLPPPAPADPKTPPPRLPPNAVQQASQLIAHGVIRDIVHSNIVTPSAHAPDAAYDRAEIVRAALIDQTVDPESPYAGVRQAATESVSKAAPPHVSHAEAHIRKEVEPVLERMSHSDPNRLAALLVRLEARYGSPMSASDAQGKLAEQLIDTVFSPADLKPGDELGKQAQKLGKDFGKKTVQTWVDARTKDFLNHALSDTAMPDVERALFLEANKPTRNMFAALRAGDAGGWRPSAATVKEASTASTVADVVAGTNGDAALRRSLGGYEQLFPAAGRAVAQVEAQAGAAAFAEARAVSFGLAARSYVARGVIIGRQLDGKPLDVTDIRWTTAPSKQAGQPTRVTVELRVTDPRTRIPAWLPAGVYDAGVLNQAIRYAADRRVVATTIQAGDGKIITRQTSLHPALMDTALGCRVIAVDRVIDTFSFLTPGPALTPFSSDRENMVQWLEVARLTEAVAGTEACPIQKVEETVAKEHMTPVRFSPALRRSLDGFVAERSSATPGSDALLRHADACASGPTSQLPRCLCAAQRLTSLPEHYWFPEDHTSQVRERRATLTPDLAWLRPSPRHLENLEFATHTTFALHGGRAHEADDSTATTLSFPQTELSVLRQEVARRLPDYVASQLHSPSYDDFTRPLEQFVLAQRLARAALTGQLGADFPLAKLISLERTTRPYVGAQPTLRWEPVHPQDFYTQLQSRNPDAARLYELAFNDEVDRTRNRSSTCGPVSK